MTLRLRAGLLASILLMAGCGGGDDTAGTETTLPTAATTASGSAPEVDEAPGSTVGSTPDTTSDTASEATLESSIDATATDGDLCSAIAGDEPPPNLAELVAPEHADAAQLILDVTAPLDLETPVPSDVIDRFAADGSSQALAAFADAIEAECGPGDPVDGVRFYSGVSALGAEAAEPGYCSSLSEFVSTDGEDGDEAAALAVALEDAPPEHVAALELLQALYDQQSAPTDEVDLLPAVQALAGLGLYAEARCDVAGAFASTLFASAFLSESFDQVAQPGAGVGAAPAEADPATATAALPPGSGVTFEVVDLDLDLEGNDAGEYLVSAVVPIGWESDVDVFGTTFEPVEGFSVFTEMTFDTGCDGMCEVTDWEARLTGPEGFVTAYRADSEMLVDRPVDGSGGIALVRRGFSDRIEGVVIRWADGADRYFQCEFAIEPSELADAFLAACEAARTGWIESA